MIDNLDLQMHTNMMQIGTHTGIGALFGYIIFVALLEGKGMGKIIWREGEFTPSGLWKYMESPFKQEYLWYPELWRHNWIIMSCSGALIGGMMSYLFC